MPPTIISSKAGNWVDRGEPAIPTMRRVLAHFFERFDDTDASWLDENANIIAGMVAADSTEIQVASYLRSIARERNIGLPEPSGARPAAIALWHIAKAALVRDFAERVLRGEIPVNAPTPEALSQWVARRLLTEDEFARFERRDPDERK